MNFKIFYQKRYEHVWRTDGLVFRTHDEAEDWLVIERKMHTDFIAQEIRETEEQATVKLGDDGLLRFLPGVATR